VLFRSVHIRRTDYLFSGSENQFGSKDISLPREYYLNCFRKCDLNEYQVIFVGDDVEWARKEFADIQGALFEHNDDPIIDFQLQLNADVLVTSNGTFSWWAGYLNEKKRKRVFAPKGFIGYRFNCLFPKGIEYKTNFEWIH